MSVHAAIGGECRMGLSLKRVSSADYENVDWETVAAATPDLDEVA